MNGRSLARFSAEPTIVENASNERCRAVRAFASQPTYTSANNAASAGMWDWTAATSTTEAICIDGPFSACAAS
jgi:hypothetical protein